MYNILHNNTILQTNGSIPVNLRNIVRFLFDVYITIYSSTSSIIKKVLLTILFFIHFQKTVSMLTESTTKRATDVSLFNRSNVRCDTRSSSSRRKMHSVCGTTSLSTLLRCCHAEKVFRSDH